MNVQTEPVKQGRKHAQVLEGARTVFLRDGFEGASVDDIAKSAGVSKATLYSYFPDKRILFMEVAKAECLRQEEMTDMMVEMNSDPNVALRHAATSMIRLFVSNFGKHVFRVCVAESDRFPELGREFWESGPARVRARMIDFFNDAIKRGQLEIEDCDLAADQFAELCKADLFPKMVFGIQEEFSDAEVARVANGAVDTFMARYGTKRAG
ncbi:MAG: TetR/AcrR family transcriptional regulator [Rhodobacteraceae bacterium]|jgi:AcrR family transcriptional regulator|nr:TetR/AcrR family transcriptional regulator [Alphaproteobacteria bacterium]MBT8476202.1 TetR/AcrR family transcriptional regulator [Alphaproteobacteria bacterium]NNF71491.1 TetR/AcrR family transcriptional regulator [Paracoccaceae bacterium]NNK68428.1 TetR/AcrR family transcriptional regulator [Paracoccaceae bacterium]